MRIELQREMISSVEARYFNINRLLLLAIGLWPYQDLKFRILQAVLYYMILVTFAILQFATFITSDCTVNLILEVLPVGLLSIIFIIKYNFFSINTKNHRKLLKRQVKCLFEQLQYIFNGLEDASEIAIMDKYGYNVKRYTTLLMTLGTCGSIIIVAIPFWPCLLNIIRPLSEPRAVEPMFTMTKYFINQEKYSYLVILHTDAALVIGVFTIVATGTTLIAYFEHACGMFKIASYRIDHAMTRDMLRNINLKNGNLIYRRIISGIDMHRKAMKYVHSTLFIFNMLYFTLMIIGVINLSLNLFNDAPLSKCGILKFCCFLASSTVILGNVIYMNLSSENITKEIILHIGSAFLQYTYMFISNIIAQNIMDHNNQIFTVTYNLQWYKAPLHVQRMILFILQRSGKAFHMNIGGLFTGSLQGFATLSNAAVSYFTLMYSTRS